MIAQGDYLYFNAYDGTIRTLWKTNGQPCGTVKVTSNTNVTVSRYAGPPTIIGNKIYILAGTTQTAGEPHVHDITTDLNVSEECRAGQC